MRRARSLSLHGLLHGLPLALLLVVGCDDGSTEAKRGAPAAAPAEPTKTAEPEPTKVAEPEPTKAAEPEPTEAAEPVVVGKCSEPQAKISEQADERAQPWSIAQHIEKNFPDKKVSWLMKEGPYQTFVVKTNAERFGRCDDTGCYLFAAPTAVIEKAVQDSMKGDAHDPAVLGKALGLPAKNFEGPLRMMTLDLAATDSCVRLPVDTDPGVWKCQSPEDTDCFKFGGYTSGGIPEVMVIDAPVAQATIKEIP